MSVAEPGPGRPELRRLAGAVEEVEARYAADVWHAPELGVEVSRKNARVSFARISPAWFREAVKSWSRQRLALGNSFNTVRTALYAFKLFSDFLGSCAPPVEDPAEIDRSLVESYLAWLARLPLADRTKANQRAFLRLFLEDNRRFRFLDAIRPDAVVYHDEVASRWHGLPRYIPEYVMAKLESEDNLVWLRPQFRHLVVVITETGLRAGDACELPFGALVPDSAGWPCLRFRCQKMRAEQLVPLSDKGVAAVREQQRLVGETFPEGTPWLFPAWNDPRLAQHFEALRRNFANWQVLIGLHDEAGRPVHVTLHQLRHSLGTRLINKGVPQHVIQRLLGHASSQMTAAYARLHDSTLREHMERYWSTRVDVEGRLIGFDPEATTADAEWLKHRLSRTADSLPNGYCGRPPRQECPHPNACLTCVDFQTTVEFLPIHRQQADATRELLGAAEADGRERLAANHRRVLANLARIIPALERLEREQDAGD